jgi:hypothetical protein
MLRIFLSYSRHDGGDLARGLRLMLENAGYKVWQDINAIPLGEEWSKELNTNLRWTDVLLLLLTPEALKSEYIGFEWRTAKYAGKRIVPVLSGVSAEEVPAELATVQACDLTGDAAMAGAGLLQKSLGGILSKVMAEVEGEARTLEAEPAYAPLRAALEKLQAMASARCYEPEVFRAALSLLAQVRAEAATERELPVLLEKVVNGGYVKPGSEIEPVFNRNRNDLQAIFSVLLKTVRQGRVFPVPVVLLAMNAAEAEALETEEAFKDCPKKLRQDFRRLRGLLKKNGADDWPRRYRAAPEDWQPFSSAEGAENISALVTRTLNEAAGPRAAEEHQIIPAFKDVRTLTAEENRGALRELRREGCVVIVDLVSIHHPAIQRHFQRSALDYYPQTSVVTIAPFNSAFDVLREMTVVLQMKVSEMEFTRRLFDRDERAVDYGACAQIFNEESLLVWLLARVQKMYATRLKSEGSVREESYNFTEGPR